MKRIFASLVVASFTVGTAYAEPVDAEAEPSESAQTAGATKAVTANLDALLARVTAESVSPESRLSAAAEITTLSSDSVGPLQKKLAELRKGPTGSILAVFNLLRDQTRGGINGDSFDLIDALCKFPKTDGPGWKATIQIAVVLQALTNIAEPRAVRAVVEFVDSHDSAFRVEITRLLKKLGEPAIPALIESKRGSVEVRKFANRTLESLGKRTAGDMVQVKSAVVQGDVLRAFGKNHDIEALSVVLSFVNSDRALVRQAAREALASYGQDGKWKLKEAYSNLTGQSAQEGWSSEEIARELFAAYDKVRLEEANQVLDQGLAAAKDGKREEAIAAFERALAMQPLLDRRREMIAVYIDHAQSFAENEPEKALAFYKRALRLDPDAERKAKLLAMTSYLEGKVLQRQGLADVEPFRHATELDPTLVEAQAELTRLTDIQESSRARIRRYAAGGALLLVAIAGILLFPRRKSTTKPARA